MTIANIIRAILSIPLYPVMIIWSKILYPLPDKERLHLTNGNFHHDSSNQASHIVFYLHGRGDFGFQNLAVNNNDVKIITVLPKIYHRDYCTYSFNEHAYHLSKSIKSALDNPIVKKVTVLAHSTGCCPAAHFISNYKPPNQTINLILVNGFESYYHMLIEKLPSFMFALLCLHLSLVGGIILTVQQVFFITSLNALSYTAIILIASILGSLISGALIYLSQYILTQTEINNLTKTNITEPLFHYIKSAQQALDPSIPMISNYKYEFLKTLPVRIVFIIFCAIACALYALIWCFAKAIQIAPRPFTYFLLWMLNSHQNTAQQLQKTYSKLLTGTLKVYQAKPDDILPSKIRLSHKLESIQNNNAIHMHETHNGHRIEKEIDCYLN